jgi:hypothetical protein
MSFAEKAEERKQEQDILYERQLAKERAAGVRGDSTQGLAHPSGLLPDSMTACCQHSVWAISHAHSSCQPG